LFAEPSPAPAKYWLARSGLIYSAEVRLPMVEVSAELAARLDLEIERRSSERMPLDHLSRRAKACTRFFLPSGNRV
jgi:4-hydroxy-tetrahydrodipicolinate synthase